MNDINTGFITVIGASALVGIPALFTPQRCQEAMIPATPFTAGLEFAIRLFGAATLSLASTAYLVKKTEQIDAKRGLLQGASIYAFLVGAVVFASRQLFDPVAWKLTMAGSLIGYVSNVFYGCLCSSDSV